MSVQPPVKCVTVNFMRTGPGLFCFHCVPAFGTIVGSPENRMKGCGEAAREGVRGREGGRKVLVLPLSYLRGGSKFLSVPAESGSK